jgi:hypothetical protein
MNIIISFRDHIDLHGWMELAGNGKELVRPFLNGKMDFSMKVH